MKWTYKGEEFDEAPEDYLGFVYLITEKSTGKKYVGKKLFWNKAWKQVKGKRKRTLKESNWKTYYGSSKSLNESVEEHGEENYEREILRLCKKKGELSYYEAKEQFDRDVLINDNYYNAFI